MSWKQANDKAFETLRSSRASLSDVQKWAAYFEGRHGYDESWTEAPASLLSGIRLRVWGQRWFKDLASPILKQAWKPM